MTDTKPDIVLYQDLHQANIDQFMAAIAHEFNITITPASVVPFNPDKYWVALPMARLLVPLHFAKWPITTLP